MPHKLTQIWIHAIWSTRDRMPLLKKAFRAQINTHLRYKFQERGCPVRIINSTVDHTHALFQLGHDASLTRIMEQVQGESSRWINQQKFLHMPFSWQTGFCALSVSGSMVKRVETFIRDQELHHQKMTSLQEYHQFLTKCGFAENQWTQAPARRAKIPFPVTGNEVEWG